ncbi:MULTISPECIES: hypothetical protein [Synechococcales]|uniref:hypothetical protein n=1 Tax=Synechococcus sp. CS-1326 TaxID=2847978 RepID=UPI000DAFA124|nr:hypothetical protein [Synechococcus sp. CS-1326]MCT0213607.1 hypothetical protein [Synechococcus sp. CS-1326]PZV02808.1 MAG: hypothetical protein DCF24_01210 [Cyanobium sp.]
MPTTGSGRKGGRAGGVTEPFRCLGFAIYESHEGERPMAIRLRFEGGGQEATAVGSRQTGLM